MIGVITALLTASGGGRFFLRASDVFLFSKNKKCAKLSSEQTETPASDRDH